VVVGGFCALLLFVVLPVHFVRIAFRVWRDPERASDTALSFSVRGAPGWVLTRGVVVVAAHFILMAVALGTTLVGATMTRTREPWVTIAVVGAAGVMLCWLLIVLIGIFNRPRFLVVPYLRDKRRL
jgi:hypothetical protein